MKHAKKLSRARRRRPVPLDQDCPWLWRTPRRWRRTYVAVIEAGRRAGQGTPEHTERIAELYDRAERPRTRYAVAVPCDQTIVYVTGPSADAPETTVHAKAHLFESRAEAQLVADAITRRWLDADVKPWLDDGDEWAFVEVVRRPYEFRRRPDTW